MRKAGNKVRITDQLIEAASARHVWADTAAVVGAIAILAHLASAWRDEGVGDLGVAFVHAAALGALAVTVNVVRAFEDRRHRT